ncbi:VanZ family protein [Fodinibius sediminis]|uniref:VanZ like family protein n=1 Tax=Fodinibius sediminis TaxID=1214077 RepID=A0A521DIF1_9BACT|nr:VanZ family protein [Fodinibius sediminis]SMO71489.1 VanZ like family protein [Fodinibius sediminis]
MNSNPFYSFLSDRSYLLTSAIAILTIVTLLLTLLPAETFSQNEIWSYDKVGHLLIFGTWTLLLGLNHSISRAGNTNLWIIFLLGISFGIIIEILQYSLPSLNRHADVYDVVFDTIGCLLALGVLKIIIPKK